MKSQRVIGVDLGGTKILAGVLDRDGATHETCEVRTPTESQEALVEGIAEAVEQVLEPGIAALGLGIPSVIDRSDGRSLGSINIPLAGIALGEVLGERFGIPAAVENDANAAALAEWRRGAGRGADDLVMLTLGTGVGGGLVLNGSLYRGWAELGHVVVVADGPPCQGNCTGRGHLEAVASGNAADRAAEELWGPGSTAEQLVERARAGDGEAVEAFARIGGLLGAAIGSFVNIFGVGLVVVGGGFGIAAADFLFEPALETARREALEPGRELRIVEAELGSDAGLVGAGLVGFEALDGERSH
ncbi:MAG: ROK family protein [Gaiellaceae bacterium]